MSLEKFKDLIETKFPAGEASRAHALLTSYGSVLAFDVMNVLMHARDQDKMEEVLSLLEEHFEKHLRYQHPNIRGQVSKVVGGNPTQRMFLAICQDTLKLSPNA